MHHVYGVTGKAFYMSLTLIIILWKKWIYIEFSLQNSNIYYINTSASGGFAPWPHNQGLCPGPHWGQSPQTPIIGSRFALTIWPPFSNSWIRQCRLHGSTKFIQTSYVPLFSDRDWFDKLYKIPNALIIKIRRNDQYCHIVSIRNSMF